MVLNSIGKPEFWIFSSNCEVKPKGGVLNNIFQIIELLSLWNFFFDALNMNHGQVVSNDTLINQKDTVKLTPLAKGSLFTNAKKKFDFFLYTSCQMEIDAIIIKYATSFEIECTLYNMM